MKGSGRSDTPIEGWMFKGGLLKPGDVLLCGDPSSVTSNAITAAIGGKFSHAAICTVVPLFIEADLPVAREFSLDRKGVMDSNNVRILRLKPEVNQADEIAAAAATIALRFNTQDYSITEAVRSVFRNSEKDPASGVFCSFVVAAAYREAGLNIAADGRQPGKTTPADLTQSPYFKDITDQLLIRIRWMPDWSMPDFIDGSATVTPALELAVALNEVANCASSFMTARGLSAVATYPEAQLSYVRAVNQTWFQEFDGKFGSWLAELATPCIAKAETLVIAAREARRSEVDPSLGAIDAAVILMALEYRTHRILTIMRLVSERMAAFATFSAILKVRDLKAVEVMKDHESQICDQLLENLNVLKEEAALYLAQAAMKGLDVPAGWRAVLHEVDRLGIFD